ncbi:YihY/virulence factor BrkB family protein [Pseudoponticoccus marisrubri]|uniref:Ribonuclease BN n=1 Tax=Pseudoponticoccus marisrubri TaxID=1685382 RepID=A0A0W7WJD3_9RHOB|nr:YihY/virulence factor BrkB family protein [Pseudoponticoccus marisrubri]KUF10701.1 ribonuclease BN [Pseudoponticoccus marisrubri]
MARGREARTPLNIPPRGYLDILWRIYGKLGERNIGLLAAGIAFYGLLSVFPGITALVAVSGMLVDPEMLVEFSDTVATLLPPQAADILLGQLDDVVGSDQSSLSLAALLATGLALFSASRAVENFIAGLNVIYEEKEERGFFMLKLLTLGLTLAMMLGLMVSAIVVAAIPAIVALVSQNPTIVSVLMLIRWPVLFALGVVGIAALYRFGPNRSAARWRWLTPGAALACTLWVAGSIGFSRYVQSFGTYNETFGALGGVIVLLTWMWLSAYIVLLGAQADAELEAQTRRDSTTGPERPMGERGAVKADTLGETMVGD